MIDFIITYWIHIVVSLLLLIGIILFIVNERKNIKEWLLYAVVESEKILGSKTGKLKLRQVYDWFISTFPIVSKLISFNSYSKLVDLALIEMKEILNTNTACKEYVEGIEANGNTESDH